MSDEQFWSPVDDLAAKLATFKDFVASQPPVSAVPMALDSIRHLPLTVTVELGRARVSIGQLLGLTPGTVLELDVKVGDPLNLLVNGCRVARGEVVIMNEQFGIRLTEISPLAERPLK